MVVLFLHVIVTAVVAVVACEDVIELRKEWFRIVEGVGRVHCRDDKEAVCKALLDRWVGRDCVDLQGGLY